MVEDENCHDSLIFYERSIKWINKSLLTIRLIKDFRRYPLHRFQKSAWSVEVANVLGGVFKKEEG